MFRPIGERLQKRAVAILKQHDTQVVVVGVLREFIRTHMPDARLEAIEVSYNERRAQLILTARSKPLASELLLRAPLLAELFRSRGLKASRIVIR